MLHKTLFTLLFLSFNSIGFTQVIDTLVDVGGHRLHFNIIKGKGIPVLFESGGGDDATVWNSLRETLKDSIGTTSITYDRAGIGKSEIDTTRISLLNEVKDLEIGLKKLGYTKDLIIVSHSLGGSYAILFSSRNPNLVKSCVFIDINLPCFITKQKAKELKEPYLTQIPTFKKEKIGIYYLIKNFEQSNDLMRATQFPSHISATVISSDLTPYKGLNSLNWKACQKSFGNLANHTYVLAERSGHYVYRDNPELVINKILKIYRRKKLKSD